MRVSRTRESAKPGRRTRAPRNLGPKSLIPTRTVYMPEQATVLIAYATPLRFNDTEYKLLAPSVKALQQLCEGLGIDDFDPGSAEQLRILPALFESESIPVPTPQRKV